METKQQFIEVFSKIGISALGDNGQSKENQADELLTTIIYGLESLSEFAFNCESETVYTMKAIRDKFDPKDRTGIKVNDFLDIINLMIIQSNRYIWDFQKIAKVMQEFKDE